MTNNFESFMTVYGEELEKAVAKYPDEYRYPVSECPTVAKKMRAGFEQGSYNKDGRAIKATCKRLGIAFTYTGINTYLKA